MTAPAIAPLRFVSLFSGIECASQAWAPLGWRCVAVAEIDPAACAVLAHRLNASAPKYLPAGADPKRTAHLPAYGTPGTLPNLGDVAQVTAADIAALGHIDVVIGGSPCQDLSVGGQRRGLAGARSGLFHHQHRIFKHAHAHAGARWLVWENVPGALSSNAGRDFAVVAGQMAGLRLACPRDGWGSEGMAAGDAGLVEWAVLDAQRFGVAQRRARVFAVLDTGNWTGRAPVLLECDSVRGDPAPARGPRQGSAGGAGGSAAGGRGSDDGMPAVANTLTRRMHKGINTTCDEGQTLVPVTLANGARAVRILTPRECERAQGVTDDWTLVPYRHGKPMADGPRYQLLGNAFAVPVAAWIGRQIQRAHHESAGAR